MKKPMQTVASKLVITNSLVIASLFAGQKAYGAIITVDPDAFAAGTNITTAFPEVTLNSIGQGFDNDSDPNIFAINPSVQPFEAFNASTGNLVFGTNDVTYPHLFGGFGEASLRVNFSNPTNLVLLDAIGNNGSDFARLEAFNLGDTLLDTFFTTQLTLSSFQTMTVSSANADISYVIASGVNGDSAGFDNLRFEAVTTTPEPTTILGLTVIAGLGYSMKHKFHKTKCV